MITKITNSQKQVLCLLVSIYLLTPLAWAKGRGCLAEHIAVKQVLVTNPPSDAKTIKESLRLQHESAILCRNGKVEEGRNKLKDAVDRLKKNGAIRISQQFARGGLNND